MNIETIQVTENDIRQLKIQLKTAKIAVKRDSVNSFEVLRFMTEAEKFFNKFEVSGL